MLCAERLNGFHIRSDLVDDLSRPEGAKKISDEVNSASDQRAPTTAGHVVEDQQIVESHVFSREIEYVKGKLTIFLFVFLSSAHKSGRLILVGEGWRFWLESPA